MLVPDCEGKRRYPSRKKAMDTLKRQHSMTRANLNPERRRGLRGLRPYWCDEHECWHLGHKPGSSTR